MASTLIGCPASLIRKPCLRSSRAWTWNSNAPNRKIRPDALDSGLAATLDTYLRYDFTPASDLSPFAGTPDQSTRCDVTYVSPALHCPLSPNPRSCSHAQHAQISLSVP